MNNNHSTSLINLLAQTLAQRLPGIVAIYHFGSFNTQGERAGSDIDLGLQADHPLDPAHLFHLAGNWPRLPGATSTWRT